MYDHKLEEQSVIGRWLRAREVEIKRAHDRARKEREEKYEAERRERGARGWDWDL